jgi:MFS family permease
LTNNYSLTTGAFLIPFGHLADICPVLSRKYLLIISLTAFSLIVAFTSFANSGIVIDIMSGLAGLACAATIPIAVGILSLVYPEPSRRKNIVFSSFLMGNPAAIIVGGLGTGGVASSFSWKATFIFLGILYAIVTVLSWWIVPNIAESRSNSELRRAQQCDVVSPFVLVSKKIPNIGGAFQKFDWTGLFLLVTGVLMFTVALTVGPEGPQPWKTPTVILLLTLGLLFLGSFIMWESSAKRPMIPPAIWENTSVVLVCYTFGGQQSMQVSNGVLPGESIGLDIGNGILSDRILDHHVSTKNTRTRAFRRGRPSLATSLGRYLLQSVGWAHHGPNIWNNFTHRCCIMLGPQQPAPCFLGPGYELLCSNFSVASSQHYWYGLDNECWIRKRRPTKTCSQY